MSDAAAEPAKRSFVDAIKGAFAPARENFGASVKNGFKNMNPLGEGVHKGKAFGKIAFTGAGAYMLGDAVLRDKTADGEKRGIVGRIVQGGVGLGVGTAAVVAHI